MLFLKIKATQYNIKIFWLNVDSVYPFYYRHRTRATVNVEQ